MLAAGVPFITQAPASPLASAVQQTASTFVPMTNLTALTRLQLSLQNMIARGLSLPGTLKDGANQACTQRTAYCMPECTHCL